MHLMSETMKEAVVWQLLESAGHPYERYDEGVQESTAELISKNIP